MQLLNFIEEVGGWWLGIMFNEKTPDKENIFKPVFFPKIDNERQMKVFNNNHLNTTHNFGEIFISGFIRYIPKIVRQKIEDSYGWSRYTENTDGSYDNRRVEEVSVCVAGIKTPLEKRYPKTYVKTKAGWVPQLLHLYYQELLRAEKALVSEVKFNSEFREGISNGTALQVLRKHTVSFTPEIVENKKEYTPVECKAFPGYDESCGSTYKSETGLFQYSLIKKNISSPSRWKDASAQNHWEHKSNFVKISA